MNKKTSRIDELLEYPRGEFSIREQRAYLLYRNKEFLQDYAKMETYFSIKQRGWQIVSDLLKKSTGIQAAVPISKLGDTANKMALAAFGRRKWPESDWFFKKWAIRDSWSGEKHSLKESVQAGPLLCAVSPAVKKTGLYPYLAVDVRGKQIYSMRELFRPRVYILVDPWTTAADIKRLCKFLPDIKDVCFGFKTESKRCYARDLCWYRLNTELGLTPTQIAKAWAEKRPDELPALIRKTREWKRAVDEDKDSVMNDYIINGLPITIRAAIGRMRAMIESLSWKWPGRNARLAGDGPIPNAEAVLDLGEFRTVLRNIEVGPLSTLKLVKNRRRVRVEKVNSK